MWAIGDLADATPAVRSPLRVAVLGSQRLVVAIGWPGLRGYGNKSDNVTIHPLDYGSAVLTVLVLLWGAALAWSAVGVSCGEETDRGESFPPDPWSRWPRFASNISNTRS